MATKSFEDLMAEGYKRWYCFGWRSPDILYHRLRNKYRPWFHTQMAWQRAVHGYSDDQLWSLNYSLARLTVVGIQKMREWKNGYPGELESWEEWDAILARIEKGFQSWLDKEGWFSGEEEEAEFKDAMTLYGHWFGGLWD